MTHPAIVTETTRFILGCACIALIGGMFVWAAVTAEATERRAYVERTV